MYLYSIDYLKLFRNDIDFILYYKIIDNTEYVIIFSKINMYFILQGSKQREKYITFKMCFS